ncbi:MAG: disulfide bond formation protein B [Legionellaceae bacterium]|nr:disulfide bond formation protein B [Legionellaceae bacterium]
MKRINRRLSFIALSWVSMLVLAASFYLEYGWRLEPCTLCLMQRYIVVLLCLTAFLCARIQKPGRLKALMGLQLFLALAGVYFAARQLWLQSLPADQVPACMPSLDTLIHYFPWQDVFTAIFLGSGDCGKVDWSLGGISLAFWSLLYFLFIGSVSLFFLWKLPGGREDAD